MPKLRRSSRWWLAALLMYPALGSAQTVQAKDLLGGWKTELEYVGTDGEAAQGSGALVLWPDGLWWYGGPLMWHNHGGARWRLVGDTLWLANDYEPYFHPMIEPRISAVEIKGYRDIGVLDTAIINKRPPYPVPDSVYWSRAFRDSTTTCAWRRPGPDFPGGCGTWVYKVSKQGPKISLVLLDSLSRSIETVATHVVMRRDSLLYCNAVMGCDYSDHDELQGWIDAAKDSPLVQALLEP